MNTCAYFWKNLGTVHIIVGFTSVNAWQYFGSPENKLLHLHTNSEATSFFQNVLKEEKPMKVRLQSFEFEKFKMGIKFFAKIPVCNHYTFWYSCCPGSINKCSCIVTFFRTEFRNRDWCNKLTKKNSILFFRLLYSWQQQSF